MATSSWRHCWRVRRRESVLCAYTIMSKYHFKYGSISAQAVDGYQRLAELLAGEAPWGPVIVYA